MKALETAFVSDPGGRIPVSLHYLRDELSIGRYMGRPLPPSLHTLLLTRDSERAAAARHAREPAPGPAIGELVDPGPGVGQGGGPSGAGAPPRQCRGRADGNPCTKPHRIQRLRLLPGKNTRVAGYSGTSRLPSWEARRSTSSDTWVLLLWQVPAEGITQ